MRFLPRAASAARGRASSPNAWPSFPVSPENIVRRIDRCSTDRRSLVQLLRETCRGGVIDRCPLGAARSESRRVVPHCRLARRSDLGSSAGKRSSTVAAQTKPIRASRTVAPRAEASAAVVPAPRAQDPAEARRPSLPGTAETARGYVGQHERQSLATPGSRPGVDEHEVSDDQRLDPCPDDIRPELTERHGGCRNRVSAVG